MTEGVGAKPVAPGIESGPGACVAVVGLGFVGLPLALSYAMAGSRVWGVDVDRRLLRDLSEGRTLHREAADGMPISAILADQLGSGRFSPTGDYAAALAAADTIIVTVGLPLAADGRADESALRSALREVGRHLRRGHLVILRSTVVPGTTERMARPELESVSGLTAGRDFDLAFCPERIAEGRAFEEFRDMPIVLGAVTPEGARRAQAALRRVTRADIRVTDDVRAAEMAKVIENIQRDVNIAIVQELAAVCEAAAIDVREVIALANTHRRVHLLDPGPGVGGYCIPNALHYLHPLSRSLGVETPTLDAARATNERVPDRIVARVLAHLRQQGIPPEGARAAVFGLAMKDYSNDDRQSPALSVAERLAAAGITVRAYDPAVRPDHPYPAATAREAIEGAHVLLVLARQEGLDPTDAALLALLLPQALVVDTRGVFRAAADRDTLLRLGLTLWTL
jgi:nucleotide sugar dehydrogenase